MSPVFTPIDRPDPVTHVDHESGRVVSANRSSHSGYPRPTTDSPMNLRRRSGGRVLTILGVFLAALLLGACTGAVSEPTSYGSVNNKGEGFYGNLMYGCTGVEPDADGNYVDEKLSSADYCKCLFNGLSDRVPFADARDFDRAQADAEPGKPPTVPDEIARVQKDCAKKYPTVD